MGAPVVGKRRLHLEVRACLKPNKAQKEAKTEKGRREKGERKERGRREGEKEGEKEEKEELWPRDRRPERK